MIIDWIDRQSDVCSQILGIPDDQVKLLSSLLISYPIGFIFKRIPSPFIKHFLGICLGLFYQYVIYREQIIHPLFLALGTYFTLKTFGRQMATIVFVGAMTYLSLINLDVMYTDWGSWKMDITIIMMIFVCRCTSFAWSYKDGGVEGKKLTARQMKKRIVELPSLFHFLSFIYFYGGAVVGPSYDYNDHEDFIYKKGDYSVTPKTFLASLGYLLSSFLALAFVAVFSRDYNAQVTLTPEFAAKTWYQKYLLIAFIEQIHRIKYFTAWLMATANVTAPGLNYDPHGKNFFERYGKIVAVRPIDHEASDNIKDKMEAWNTPTQIWLKDYVYLRLVTEDEAKQNPSKATFASNVTFMVSAFWHGFYPGYYITFFCGFLLQQISKSLFKIRSRLSWIPEPIGFILRWTLTKWLVDFAALVFALLDYHKAMIYFRALNYVPIIVLFSAYALLSWTSLGKKPRAKDTEAKQQPQEIKKTQ